MKTVAFAFALLLGGAALAQTGLTAYDGDGAATIAFETDAGAAGMAPAATLAGAVSADGAQLVLPGNAAPELDARGIPVVSDPATVPAGWNGTSAGAATGGPLLDPVTGEPVAEADYPACTRAVTDNCLQTYEKGRRG
jgi:hypothetical protein